MTITKEGTLASFYTVNKAPIKHLRVYFSPKQAGEGDPSPSNVREIEGWNGINVKHAKTNLTNYETYSITFPTLGKNLLNTPTETSGNVIYAFGRTFASSIPDKSIYLPAGTYTVSANMILDILTVNGPNGAIIGNSLNNVSSYTFTIEEACAIGIVFAKYGNTEEMKCQLEAGSIATAYEPFNNTIYGGYVDLVTGELVQTHAKYVEDGTINTDTWYLRKQSSLLFAQKSLSYLGEFQPKLGYQTGIFNYLISPLSFSIWCGAIGANANINNNSPANNDLRMIIPTNDFPYVLSLIHYLNEHPLEFTYELETPITYQLTPTQLQTFIGRNNIWSNADRVEVEYDLAESNDELYRRRNQILKASPHLVSVASGNTVDSEAIAHFITNDTLPLKSCIVDIQPFQSGSGTPSPENIREISGQNSIKIRQDGVNIFDKNNFIQKSYYFAGGGQIKTDSNLRSKTAIIECSPNTTYTVYKPSSNKNDRFAVGYSDHICEIGETVLGVVQDTVQTSNGWTSVQHKLVLTTDRTAKYLYIRYRSGYSYSDSGHTSESELIETILSGMQVEIGENEKSYNEYEYKPYNSIVSTITLPDTIYNGQLNLLTGILTVTSKKYIFNGSENWDTSNDSWNSDNTGFCIINSDLKTNKNLIACDSFKIIESTNNNFTFGTIRNKATNAYNLKVRMPQSLSLTEFKNYLSNNNLNLIAELATPLTYQLTPQTIRTLRGVNNIWSNAGPVSLQYWTH